MQNWLGSESLMEWTQESASSCGHVQEVGDIAKGHNQSQYREANKVKSLLEFSEFGLKQMYRL